MSLVGLSDEELMNLYQGGSETAFQVLFERHSSRIFSYLRKRIKNNESIDDIFQEVFVKMHISKHLYKKNLPVLPWLFSVTRSVMIDQIRKDKSSKFIDGYDLEKIPQIEKNSQQDFATVMSAINELPDSQRTAMQMRYVNEKTFEEIAESLKTSPLNARKLISRGVKRLRELIDGENS